MTTSDTRTIDRPVPPQISPFDHAVLRVMEETGCSVHDAVASVEFIQQMADLARSGERWSTPGTHHLNAEEMSTDAYATMDQIMEHGRVAAPGSAHAAVEALVLNPEAGEIALMHDNPTGRRQDCVVAIRVNSVS